MLEGKKHKYIFSQLICSAANRFGGFGFGALVLYAHKHQISHVLTYCSAFIHVHSMGICQSLLLRTGRLFDVPGVMRKEGFVQIAAYTRTTTK